MNKSFRRVIGARGATFFFLGLPFGFLQGLIEVLFGFALLYFLSSFGLTPHFTLPAWFPADRLHPTWFLLGVGFARWVCGFLSTVGTNICYESFCSNVRARFATALRFPASASRLSVAELSNVFSNLLPKSAGLLLSVSDVLTRLLILFVTLWGLLMISRQLTWISLGAIALLILPVLISRKFFQTISASIYADSRKFTERLMQNMRNLDFLRIIGRTGAESDGLIQTSNSIFRKYIHYISWITGSSSWPQFGAVGVIALMVIVNARRSFVPVAALIPFIYLLSRFTANMGDVMRAAGTIEFNWPFAKNLASYLERMDADSEMLPPPTASSHAPAIASLSVKDLTIGRDQPLLNGLGFSAKKGDLVLIGGPSGRGKTTLLMTLIGLVPPLGGAVTWDGRKPGEFSELLSKVAYSGADPFLLDATVRENVLLGNEQRTVSDSELNEALRLCECEFLTHLPQGLNTKLSEGGEGISTGQKQRLSLARALLRRPDVLLLDEATSNIDLPTERKIIENLRKALPNALVFAVSHRRSLEDVATVKINLSE